MGALKGSCLCGGVRFEVRDEFSSMAFCHCTTCKKLSGGVGTAGGYIRTEAIRILEGDELLRTYQPDEGNPKTFCSVCGSNLFGGGWPHGEHSGIRLSALDSPSASRPAAHIFTRGVAEWEAIPDDGLERFEARPPT